MTRVIRPFSHYEIHRCAEVDVTGHDELLVEQVDTDEELAAFRAEYASHADVFPVRVFWTLYGRYEPSGGFGGLEAIADRETEEDCVSLLESILNRPLEHERYPWGARDPAVTNALDYLHATLQDKHNHTEVREAALAVLGAFEEA